MMAYREVGVKVAPKVNETAGEMAETKVDERVASRDDLMVGKKADLG